MFKNLLKVEIALLIIERSWTFFMEFAQKVRRKKNELLQSITQKFI
jgi:hypothetical protein